MREPGTPKIPHVPDKPKSFIEALYTSTVSVKDLIPDLNTEGLSLKNNTPPTNERGRTHFTDAVEDRELNHLSSELASNFASLLYAEDVDASKKRDNLSESKLRLEKALNAIKKELKEVFNGQIVIDLAAGHNTFGYRIIDQARPRAYVALEPAFGNDLAQEMLYLLNPEIEDAGSMSKSQEERNREYSALNKTPVAIVEEDMLSFLRRLPENSVSLWCSGIDYNVIPDQDYRDEVAREILRVLHPKGAYVGQTRMSIQIPDTSSEVQVTFVGEKEKDLYGGGEEKATYSSVNIYRKTQAV